MTPSAAHRGAHLECELRTSERLVRTSALSGGSAPVAGRPDVLAIWTQATKRKAGNPTGANQHSKPEDGDAGIVDNINSSTPERPTGTSAAAGLRRLQAAAAPTGAHLMGELRTSGKSPKTSALSGGCGPVAGRPQGGL
jgi:hypothetical protein